MKIGGVEVKGPSEEILILPRLTGDIVIRARAVTELDEFTKRFPEPKPRGIRTAKKGFQPDVDDPVYKQEVATWNELYNAFLLIKSLEPSEIEWDHVDVEKPSTWGLWKQDLLEAGLSIMEVSRIVTCVSSANCLDEGKLERAREVFLRGLEEREKEFSGPEAEPPSTQSGEPVNA